MMPDPAQVLVLATGRRCVLGALPVSARHLQDLQIRQPAGRDRRLRSIRAGEHALLRLTCPALRRLWPIRSSHALSVHPRGELSRVAGA
jgi:hypothetical protein